MDAADLAAGAGALGDQLVLGKGLAADLLGLAKVALAQVVGGQRAQLVEGQDVGRGAQLVVLFHGVGVQHLVVDLGVGLFVGARSRPAGPACFWPTTATAFRFLLPSTAPRPSRPKWRKVSTLTLA